MELIRLGRAALLVTVAAAGVWAAGVSGDGPGSTIAHAGAAEVGPAPALAAAQPRTPTPTLVPTVVEAVDLADRGIIPRSKPLDPNLVRVGEPDVIVRPELLDPNLVRVGDTLTLEPSAVKSAVQYKLDEGVFSSCNNPWQPDGLPVGWLQIESMGCDRAWVAQTAVTFSFEALDRLPTGTQIKRAVLTHDEEQLFVTNGDGTARTVSGCVSVVGVATSNWPNLPVSALFPNQGYLNVAPGSAREWNVTDPFERQVSRAAPRFGFVLRGSLEEVEGNDDFSCMSEVSNIRLHVTYELPADDHEPFRAPG